MSDLLRGAVGVFAVLVLAGLGWHWVTGEEAGSDVAGRQAAVVTRNVDGDTLAVNVVEEGPVPAGEVTVRLLLVDTPETVHPTVSDECYGREASEMLARLAPVGARVALEVDTDLQDRYGRWLAYMWVGDRMVNELLVSGGYGDVAVYAPNDRYEDRMRAAEDEARGAHRGLWGHCTG